MKNIYLVSFFKIREGDKNITTYAYAFASSEEAYKFKNELYNTQCATVSMHEVFNTCEDALTDSCTEIQKIIDEAEGRK